MTGRTSCPCCVPDRTSNGRTSHPCPINPTCSHARGLLDDPVLKNHNVKLTISTSGIAIVIIETNQVIANHIMPCISFATGGDAVDYDIIGYVCRAR